MVIWVNFVQTELMVEICSKRLVRAIGKVLLLALQKNKRLSLKGPTGVFPSCHYGNNSQNASNGKLANRAEGTEFWSRQDQKSTRSS